MKPTYDVNVESFIPLVSPRELKAELPLSEAQCDTVLAGRREVEDILMKRDSRLLVIAGPCSIHNEKAAMEYARRLLDLREKAADTICLIMRVYFEKPRTTVGWKGMINDPDMDGSCDIVSGLKKARRLLRDITDLGMPAATELLDPITPQYIAGLISWAAIGARTTESQTHREMASGLSMPVGFKNCTDGGLDTAINAMTAARSSQSFLGIDPEGKSAVVKTRGNPMAHIVLRGGKRPNYDSVSIGEARAKLAAKNLPEAIVVDCSHSNSARDFRRQAVVWQDVVNQRLDGNDAISGLMLESHLNEGSQKLTDNPADLQYGVSVTDACISWETTEQLILSARNHLASGARARYDAAA
ncbi:MAG: 3-deoxy-7-phosphoheptulonate synthase [Desulfobacterales bacterium]|nr:MAG: 3-deoxy-7-phosphoheptulonate synthase [Desulfobacterales bacterium]